MGTNSEWTSPLLEGRHAGVAPTRLLGGRNDTALVVGKTAEPYCVGAMRVVGGPLIRWFEERQDDSDTLSDTLAKLPRIEGSGGSPRAQGMPCVRVFISHRVGDWPLEEPQWSIMLAGASSIGESALLQALLESGMLPSEFQAKRAPVCVVVDTAQFARSGSLTVPFCVREIALSAFLHDQAHYLCGVHWRTGVPDARAAWFNAVRRASVVLPPRWVFQNFGSWLRRSQALLEDPRTGQARLADPVFQTLSTLDDLAARGESFGAAAKALERLAGSDSGVTQRLLRTVQRREHHARVRWFILETIARHSPAARIAELLLEALRTWPEEDADHPEEGMALLGAVIALRAVKMPMELRESVRSALITRLNPKRSARDWRGQLVTVQIVGQMLAALGSFAEAEELELFRDFWQGGHDFTITLNAIDAAKRTARRHRRAPQTGTFFEFRGEELRDWLFSFAQARGTQREIAALFWAMVALVSARHSDEMRFLASLVGKQPALRPQLLREVIKTRAWLKKRDSAWLASQPVGSEAFSALQEAKN